MLLPPAEGINDWLGCEEGMLLGIEDGWSDVEGWLLGMLLGTMVSRGSRDARRLGSEDG